MTVELLNNCFKARSGKLLNPRGASVNIMSILSMLGGRVVLQGAAADTGEAIMSIIII